jgi:hypothetical protein
MDLLCAKKLLNNYSHRSNTTNDTQTRYPCQAQLHRIGNNDTTERAFLESIAAPVEISLPMIVNLMILSNSR